MKYKTLWNTVEQNRMLNTKLTLNLILTST